MNYFIKVPLMSRVRRKTQDANRDEHEKREGRRKELGGFRCALRRGDCNLHVILHSCLVQLT